MGHDRAFSPSIFQDRSVKIHPPPLPSLPFHQQHPQVGVSHSWPRVVHPPVPIQQQDADFSAPGRRGAVDGGDVEVKNWWGAHVRDQQSLQEAAWLLGQGLGNLNMICGSPYMGARREGSVSSEGDFKPGQAGLEVTLSAPTDPFYQTPPNNQAPGVGMMAGVDLGIRRFSDGGVPLAVNPQVLTTGHLDSFLQPVEPGQGVYSASHNQPFMASSSVPLPAPRNLRGGFDYSRTSSYQTLPASQGLMNTLSLPSDAGDRRDSMVSLSSLSLHQHEPPVLCGAPMDLIRPNYTPMSNVNIHQTPPQTQFYHQTPSPPRGESPQMLTRRSVLGLDNVLPTQTGVDANTTLGILGSGDYKWDESFVPGYQSTLDSTIPANSALNPQRMGNEGDNQDGSGQVVPAPVQAMQDPGSAAAWAAAPQFLSTPNCKSSGFSGAI